MGRLLQGERYPTNRRGGRFIRQDPGQLHENRHTACVVVGAWRSQCRVVVGAHHQRGSGGGNAWQSGDDVAKFLSAALIQIVLDPVSGLREGFFDVFPGLLQVAVAPGIPLSQNAGQKLDVSSQPELNLTRQIRHTCIHYKKLGSGQEFPQNGRSPLPQACHWRRREVKMSPTMRKAI